MKESREERFWEKVELIPFHSCWEWVAAKTKLGYGKFSKTKGGWDFAHRYSYELIKGKIPHGKMLDHLCRNPSCVNPNHLEPVTGYINQLRSPISLVYKNSLKTNCPKGHPYSGNNLFIERDGSRKCRICRKIYDSNRVRSSSRRLES